MKKIILLTAMVGLVCYSPSVFANNNSKSAAAAAAKAKEAAAAREQKAADDEKKVQEHLAYLQKYLPNLTEADIKGISNEDLRHFYFKAYTAQGMSPTDARQKSDQLVFE